MAEASGACGTGSTGMKSDSGCSSFGRCLVLALLSGVGTLRLPL